MDRPKYSFVTWTANDSYGMLDDKGPTPKQRLLLSVGSMVRQTLLLPEIIVVDPTAPPDVEFELPPYVQHVPIPYEKLHARFPDARYSFPFLLNHGIRRATGEYIIACTADDFFMPDFLEVVDTLVDPNTLVVCSKYYVTTLPRFGEKPYWHGVEGAGSADAIMAEIERQMAETKDAFPHDPFQAKPTQTGHDMHLMHRDAWHSMRGYDERLTGWGFTDIQLCTRAFYAGHNTMNAALYGARMFHLDHRREDPHRLNDWLDPMRVVVNDDKWGIL